jgi:hypothetical protein
MQPHQRTEKSLRNFFIISILKESLYRSAEGPYILSSKVALILVFRSIYTYSLFLPTPSNYVLYLEETSILANNIYNDRPIRNECVSFHDQRCF